MPSPAPAAELLSPRAWLGSVMLMTRRSLHGHVIAGKAQTSMLCCCSSVSLRMSAAASSILAGNLAVTPEYDCAGHAATHEQGGKDGPAAEAGAGPYLESGAPNMVLLHCSTSDIRCVVDMHLLWAHHRKQLRLLSRSLLHNHCCVHRRPLLLAGTRIVPSQSLPDIESEELVCRAGPRCLWTCALWTATTGSCRMMARRLGTCKSGDPTSSPGISGWVQSLQRRLLLSLWAKLAPNGRCN